MFKTFGKLNLKKISLLALFSLAVNCSNIFALTCTSKATGNWSAAATWTGCGGVTPGASDSVIISTHLVTLNLAATVTGLTLSTASANNSLTVGTNSLTINGNLVMCQPSGAFRSGLNIHKGTVTVSGIVFFAGNNVTATRISSMTITSGTLNANGGMTFVGSAAATKVIIMSGGTGTINLKGALTVPALSSTLTAGTLGSTFNYADTTNAQTINFFTAGAYNNLSINNTSASGATLGAAITTANLTRNLSVQSGTLKNGGFAITGTATRTIQVSNGATFEMSGASAFPTGFSTFTFGATSRVRYLQTTAAVTISTQPFGHLDLKPSATATHTFPAGTVTIAGDLTLGNGTNTTSITANTNATVLTVSGNVNIAANTTLTPNNANTTTVRGNWSNSGTFTAGTSSITFAGTSSQLVHNNLQSFSTVISSNVSSAGLTFTSSFTASRLFVNAAGLSSAATIYFAGNSTFTISTLTLTGTAANHVVLKSTDVASWYLKNTTSNNVSYVEVQYSSASTGKAIANVTGTDLGNNANWVFTDNGIRYWAATASSNWTSANSWALASGGSPGAPIPTSTSVVVFDGVSLTNGGCLINTNITVATMTINGYTGTINSQGYSIIISSAFVQSTGQVTLSTSLVTLQGDFIKTAGGFGAATSSITFSGGNNQTLTPNATGFANVIINKSGGTISLTNNLFVNGNWTNTTGTFDSTTSTITFNATVAGKTIRSGTQIFGHTTFNGTGGTWTLLDAFNSSGFVTLTAGTLSTTVSNFGVDVDGDLLINGGTLTLNASTVTVGGSWTRTSGTFTAGTSTITFNGTGQKYINVGTQNFYRVSFNGAGSTWTLVNQFGATGQFSLFAGTIDTGNNFGILASSDVVLRGGVFDLNNSTMIVTGLWDNDGTTSMIPINSTVTFNGTAARTFRSGQQAFANVVFSGAAGIWTLRDQLNASGFLTITNGTLNTSTNNYGVDVDSDVLVNGGTLTLNASTVTVGGSWIRTAGTFTAGTSTITFNSSNTGQKYITMGAQQFYRVSFNGAGSTWTLREQMSPTGQLSIFNGTLNTGNNFGVLASSDVVLRGGSFNLNNSTMIVTGLWDNDGGTNFIPGNSTVTFNGTAARRLRSGNDPFTHLIFSGVSGIWTLQDQLTATGKLTLTNGTLNTSTSNMGLDVDGDVLLNGGTLSLNASTVTFGGNWTRTSGTFTAGTSTATFNATSAKTINAGAQNFYRVEFNGVGGTWTLQTQLTVSGQLKMTNGTLNTSASNYGILASSDVIMNGGGFTMNSSTMIVNGHWISTSGSYSGAASTVTFSGSSNQILDGTGVTLNHVQINKAGGQVSLSGPVTMAGSFTQTLGGFTTNGQALTLAGSWTRVAGGFTGNNSTVTFNGSGINTLTGLTTFYGLQDLTSGATLQFTANTTFYVTGMLSLKDISVKSTTNGTFWYFTYTGSTQSVVNVLARDSRASGGLLITADARSTNVSNNLNWDFGAPSAVINFSANPGTLGATLDLSWSAPGADGSVGTLNNSTFTIQYTTDTIFAGGSSWDPTAAQPGYVSRIIIATTAVTAGSNQFYTLPSVTDGSTYYLRVWTKDNNGITSSISNGATDYVTTSFLGIQLSTNSIQFGSLLPGTTNVITSSVTVTNTGNIVARFQVSIDSPTIWNPTSNPTGVDTFRLSAIFKSTLPVAADFSLASDIITTSTVTASATLLARDADATSEKGISVSPGTSRGLWFRIEMPTITSTLSDQAITLHATSTP